MRHSVPVSFFASMLGAVLSLPGALAQSSATAAQPLATPVVRITAAPSESALTTLRGNTSPMAQSRYDRGTASASMATGTMTLLLQRSPAQQQALTQYLGALQNPQSSSYHKWLTPQTFGANFGIAQQDLQTVEQWLQSQGFKIEKVPAGLSSIQFSGNVGQVEQAFHTSIHSYVVNGAQHYSNNADPQIPSALAPVIAGVSPLNDFRPRPLHVLNGRAQKDRSTGATHPLNVQVSHPLFTDTGSNPPILYLGPADAATIYDSPNAMNKNFSGSTAFTGTGVNVGTINDSDLPLADYLNYRKFFLNETSPANPVQVIDGVDPGVQYSTGDAAEAVIDAELLAGLAPGATVYFYSSNSDLLQNGIYDAALRAVEDNEVALLSVSFGGCEAEQGGEGNAELSALWQQAAAQGITVSAATGDNGSAACDDPDTENAAQDGLAVNGYASTPYDVAVGGTDFDTLTTDFSTYVSSAVPDSSTTYGADLGSALSYIPENPWNDSISNNPPGAYTSNTAAQYTSDGSTFTSIAAGSGGVSSSAVCSSNDYDNEGDCISSITGEQLALAGYPIPSFQQGSAFSSTPLNGSKVRNLPDVSIFAADGVHQATWGICSDNLTNQDSSGTYTDCEVDSSGNFTLSGYGGTSTAAPSFTGMLALVINELPSADGGRLGLADNVLYNLASTQYSTVFHDITAGNNSVLCEAGSPNCGSNDFLTGYNAGTNYDLATGLGSIDVSALAKAWSGVSFTPTSVTLAANSGTTGLTVTHGAAVTLATTVTPSAATGTVSVNGPANAAGASVNQDIPLTNGSGSISTTALPGGTYNITAYYPGDATHAPSTSSPIPVTVSPEASSLGFQVSEYSLQAGTTSSTTTGATVFYGEEGYAYAQPLNSADTNADGPATGTMTLNNGGTAISTTAFSSTQTLNSEGVAAYPLYDLAPATYSLSASYGGDASYKASTSQTIPLVIQKGPTSLSITPSSTSIAASASVTVTVQLDTNSVGAYPTGAISLSANNTTFTATSVVNATLPTGAEYEIATFTVPGASLASGANTLTASYPGDTNYSAAGNATTTVTVSGSSTGAGFSITGPSAGITIASVGSSGTGTLTIAPTGGFTGTVSLSCKFPVQIGGSVSPTCTVPASVSITSSAPVTATVTVNTTTGSAALATDTPLHRLLFGGSGVALGALLLFGIPARRRSWRVMLVALLAVGLMGAIGCGSSSSNGNGGTSTGSYTLTVTGTSGSTTGNATIPVVVN